MRQPDPIARLKQEVAAVLVAKLDGWSQDNAAALIGSDQPRVSDLRRGRLKRLSLERLLRFVAHLGGTVALVIDWPPRRIPRTALPATPTGDDGTSQPRWTWPRGRRASPRQPGPGLGPTP